MCSETLVRIEEINGRGRGVVSVQPLKGGTIVLRDSPIVLYSARPLTNSTSFGSHYCDHCFKKLHTNFVSCPSCSLQLFCTPNCATASFHTPWLCQALSRIASSQALLLQPVERQVQARFLVAAYNLAVVSPSNFQILLSLQGRPRPEDDEDAQFLHSLFSSLCRPPMSASGTHFSLELTSALLAKDKFNAFGLMEPFDLNGDSGEPQRSVRAYGIYPKASLFNHDCLPNACRFDYVDTQSTDLIIRMIHDVPEGREICLSYFPVNYNYNIRQKRLLEDYGFVCDCDRCKVEVTWSDQEDDDDDDDENEAMEEDPDESTMVDGDDDDDDDDASRNDNNFPHAYFFSMYMCDRLNCGGTLAPVPPSNANPASGNSNLLECNVCGNIKADEAGKEQGV